MKKIWFAGAGAIFILSLLFLFSGFRVARAISSGSISIQNVSVKVTPATLFSSYAASLAVSGTAQGSIVEGSPKCTDVNGGDSLGYPETAEQLVNPTYSINSGASMAFALTTDRAGQDLTCQSPTPAKPYIYTFSFNADVSNISPGTSTITACVDDGGVTRCDSEPFYIAPPPLLCSPANTVTAANIKNSFIATGGAGSYAWSAPAGSPDTGSGTNFTTAYNSPGSDAVTVTDSGGTKAVCNVTVNATPVLSADAYTVVADGITGDALHVTNGTPLATATLHYSKSSSGISGTDSMCTTDSSGACDKTYGPWATSTNGVSNLGTWNFYVTQAINGSLFGPTQGPKSNIIAITFVSSSTPPPNVTCHATFPSRTCFNVGDTVNWSVSSTPTGYPSYYYQQLSNQAQPNIYRDNNSITYYSESYTLQDSNIGTVTTEYFLIGPDPKNSLCTTNSWDNITVLPKGVSCNGTSPPSAQLQIVPTSASVKVGSTTAFSVNYLDSQGQSTVVTNAASWNSSDGSVLFATTNPGTFRGVSAGSASARASYLGLSVSAPVTVTAISGYSCNASGACIIGGGGNSCTSSADCGTTVCTPNTTTSCSVSNCGLTNSGIKTCNSNGSGWSVCSASMPSCSPGGSGYSCSNNCTIPVAGGVYTNQTNCNSACGRGGVIINNFSATSSAPIVPLQTVTLTWTSSNATSCSIDNGIGTVATNGSVTVAPTSTTTYILTCTGPGGSASKSFTVDVGGVGQHEVPPS